MSSEPKTVGRVSPIGRNPTKRSQVSTSGRESVGLRCDNPIYENEWAKSRLGDLITYKKGFAFKSKDYLNVGVPVIRVSNFTDDSISNNDLKFVSEEVAGNNNDVRLKANDIVVATVGSWPNNPASVVGRTISVPGWAEAALMNQNSVIIKANSRSFYDQRFIYYQMKSPEFANHVISKAQGSANQASITLEAIFSFPLFWPNIDQRKSVVHVLNALDDRIALLRETNATLEAIAQALFKSWFVDFDPVHAKQQGRAPEGMDEATAALFPDSFEESELGLVPRGWKVDSIYRIAHIIYGAPFSSKRFNTEKIGTPLIRIRDLKNETPGVYTDEVHPKGYLTQPGDIVVGMDGEFRAYLWGGEPAWLNQRVCVFQSTEEMPSAFVHFRIIPLLAAVEASETATTVIHLGKNDIDRFRVVVPTTGVLKIFGDVVNPIYEKIVEGKQAMANLATLRDTLLPRLISGQLRLPDDNTSHE
jgi:type I restriction enzyme S subunit